MKIEELFPLKVYPFSLRYHIECKISSDLLDPLEARTISKN